MNKANGVPTPSIWPGHTHSESDKDTQKPDGIIKCILRAFFTVCVHCFYCLPLRAALPPGPPSLLRLVWQFCTDCCPFLCARANLIFPIKCTARKAYLVRFRFDLNMVTWSKTPVPCSAAHGSRAVCYKTHVPRLFVRPATNGETANGFSSEVSPCHATHIRYAVQDKRFSLLLLFSHSCSEFLLHATKIWAMRNRWNEIFQ